MVPPMLPAPIRATFLRGGGAMEISGGWRRASYHRAGAGPALAALLLAGCGGGEAPRREPPDTPASLILVSIDTLRADHLGAYGYPRPTSPHLDRLAGRGVRFADVLTQSTSTKMSHKSIFASVLPSRHRGSLEGFETLAETLAAAGFDTAAFVDGGYMRNRFGNGDGFGLYVDDLSGAALPGERPVADRKGGGFEVLLPRAEAWLAQRGARPFFLFLHSYDTHCPYDPPEEYRRLFEDAAAQPVDLAGLCGWRDFGPERLTPAVRTVIRDRYDAGIRHADARLGAFLDRLGAAGLLARTVVAVVSDHGESLGEREWVGHNRLHAPQLFVPWIMAGPGLPAPRVVDTPAQLVDVMPTLLDLLGYPVPDGLAGSSLMPAVRSGGGEADRLRVCEIRGARALLRGPWVLVQRIRDLAPLRLYRRDLDPEAAHNLAPQYPDVVSGMQASWTATAARLGVGAGDLPADEVVDDERIRQELRSLGYLE